VTKMLPLEDGYISIPDDPGSAPPNLLGSYSPAADTYFYPRRKLCPISLEPVEDCELSSDGELYSWTFVYRPVMGKRIEAEGGGYGVGQIDLPEGVRVQARIDGAMGDWKIGMKMRMALDPLAEDEDGNSLCGFKFVPVSEEGAAS